MKYMKFLALALLATPLAYGMERCIPTDATNYGVYYTAADGTKMFHPFKVVSGSLVPDGDAHEITPPTQPAAGPKRKFAISWPSRKTVAWTVGGAAALTGAGALAWRLTHKK